MLVYINSCEFKFLTEYYSLSQCYVLGHVLYMDLVRGKVQVPKFC